MIFRCDCVWVREGGVLRERYIDVCAWSVCAWSVCVCVCVCVCAYVNTERMCVDM